jgi:hypothetical protein
MRRGLLSILVSFVAGDEQDRGVPAMTQCGHPSRRGADIRTMALIHL